MRKSMSETKQERAARLEADRERRWSARRLKELDDAITSLIIDWNRDPEACHAEFDGHVKRVLEMAADGKDVTNLARVLLQGYDGGLVKWMA
jgi:hypothetical protein